jgi:hypothetical protein
VPLKDSSKTKSPPITAGFFLLASRAQMPDPQSTFAACHCGIGRVAPGRTGKFNLRFGIGSNPDFHIRVANY